MSKLSRNYVVQAKSCWDGTYIGEPYGKYVSAKTALSNKHRMNELANFMNFNDFSYIVYDKRTGKEVTE